MENSKKNEMNLENVEFEEMEQAEELGDAKDFLTGVGVGVSIVAGIIAIT